MKAFIYSKKNSKLVKTLKNVIIVYSLPDILKIYTLDDEYNFDIHKYKTTIYQN